MLEKIASSWWRFSNQKYSTFFLQYDMIIVNSNQHLNYGNICCGTHEGSVMSLLLFNNFF